MVLLTDNSNLEMAVRKLSHGYIYPFDNKQVELK